MCSIKEWKSVELGHHSSVKSCQVISQITKLRLLSVNKDGVHQVSCSIISSKEQVQTTTTDCQGCADTLVEVTINIGGV